MSIFSLFSLSIFSLFFWSPINIQFFWSIFDFLIKIQFFPCFRLIWTGFPENSQKNPKSIEFSAESKQKNPKFTLKNPLSYKWRRFLVRRRFRCISHFAVSFRPSWTANLKNSHTRLSPTGSIWVLEFSWKSISRSVSADFPPNRYLAQTRGRGPNAGSTVSLSPQNLQARPSVIIHASSFLSRVSPRPLRVTRHQPPPRRSPASQATSLTELLAERIGFPPKPPWREPPRGERRVTWPVYLFILILTVW